MFIQLITATSSTPTRLAEVYDRWADDATTNGTATRTWLTRDRDDSEHFALLAVFPTHEDAMVNSRRDETNAYSREFAQLCDGDPAFRDLDVIETATTS